MAERVGFEPTCRLRDKTLSRRPRYDHFGTSPCPVPRRSRLARLAARCADTNYTRANHTAVDARTSSGSTRDTAVAVWERPKTGRRLDDVPPARAIRHAERQPGGRKCRRASANQDLATYLRDRASPVVNRCT